MKIYKYDVVCEKVASYDIRKKVKSSEDVAEFITKGMKIGKYAAETFWVIMLNSKLEIVGVSQVGKGNVVNCPADTAEVYRAALSCGTCAAIVVAHNHPSESLKASADDIEVTEKMVKAGELLGIKVMDQVIVGGDSWVSMRAEGYIV